MKKTGACRKSELAATKAWSIACVALFIICGPMLMGIGIARGWNTSLTSGKLGFETLKDSRRFWPEPNEHPENNRIDSQIAGRDFATASSTWYYWKLRPSLTDHCDASSFDPFSHPQIMSCQVPQASAITRATVWVLYVLHQCIIWALIYKAQREHDGNVQYHEELRWYNVWSLIANLVFYLLHLLQTHLTYDAIAQDVTEASSQASVIMLIVMVLVMEYKHRGLFLGWPAGPTREGCCNWRLPSRPIELIRKYHGYAFSWATIFTLWYHPMEPTVGHVLGFLHTGFLLIQQSLMYTPIHVNKYWKLLLEAWVAIHGGVVAAQTNKNGLWGMFAFGFSWMFVFTQIHGLPYYLGFVQVSNTYRYTEGHKEEAVSEEQAITNNISEDTEESNIDAPSTITTKFSPKKRWQRIFMRLFPVLFYFAVVILCYATVLSKEDEPFSAMFLTEIIRIPSILYLMALFTVIIGWGMLRSVDFCQINSTYSTSPDCNNVNAPIKHNDDIKDKETTDEAVHSIEEGYDIIANNDNVAPSKIGTGVVLVSFTICYGAMVSISILIEQYHWQMSLIILMVMLTALFTFLALMAMIIMDKHMQRTTLGSPQLPENDKNLPTTPTKQLTEDKDSECPSIVASISN